MRNSHLRTSVSSSVSYCVCRLGLDRGVDLGSIGEDLEGPGLAQGVGLGHLSVVPVEV